MRASAKDPGGRSVASEHGGGSGGGRMAAVVRGGGWGGMVVAGEVAECVGDAVEA